MTNTSYSTNIPLTEKLVILSLVLYQILSTYGKVSYWSYAVLFSYFVSILVYLNIFTKKTSVTNKFPKHLVYFFIYWIIVHLVSNLGHSSMFPQNIALILFYYVAFWSVLTADNLHVLIKYYKVVAWVCIGFFYIQEISVLTTGVRISGIFSFLPYALHAHDYDEFMYRLAASSRSASFFSEPSYFAQYIIPLLAIELFNSSKKTHYIRVAIIGASLILSQSGTGIITVAAIVIVYFVKLFVSDRKKIKYGILSVILLVVFAGWFSTTPIGQSMIERQSELSIENQGGSRSGYMRVYRGLLLFDEYSIVEKIFGNNNDQRIVSLTQVSSLSNDFGDNQDTFFNGVQYCLLRTGFIGLFIFLCMFYDIWKGNCFIGKAIILSFFFLMMLEAVFFTNNMLLYLILAQRFKDCNQKNTLNTK